MWSDWLGREVRLSDCLPSPKNGPDMSFGVAVFPSEQTAGWAAQSLTRAWTYVPNAGLRPRRLAVAPPATVTQETWAHAVGNVLYGPPKLGMSVWSKSPSADGTLIAWDADTVLVLLNGGWSSGTVRKFARRATYRDELRTVPL